MFKQILSASAIIAIVASPGIAQTRIILDAMKASYITICAETVPANTIAYCVGESVGMVKGNLGTFCNLIEERDDCSLLVTGFLATSYNETLNLNENLIKFRKYLKRN